MSGLLIQRARDIVADTYLAIQAERETHPDNLTADSWNDHVKSYSSFMRSGAYDNDIAVRSTLAALKLLDVEAVLQAALSLVSDRKAA